MSCAKILDMVYESSGDNPHGSISIAFDQLQIWMHTLVCPDCAQQIERFEVSKNILSEDFFPYSPALEDSIMTKIAEEEELAEAYETHPVRAGFSFRGWVIAGFIIFISLVSAYFGLDFQKLASSSGVSFMLPVGLTFGIVLTSYGAFFIGSHLKEFSERFGL